MANLSLSDFAVPHLHQGLCRCVQCSGQCTAFSVHIAVSSVYCSGGNVKSAICSLQCAVGSVQLAVCSVQCVVCTMKYTG